VTNFKQDDYHPLKEVGTILEVTLAKPMLPNSKTTFTLDFEGQVQFKFVVPDEIMQLSELSMAQWYQNLPNLILKVGMQIHTSQEFHGVWEILKLLLIKLCFRVERVTCKTK
jgi:hypothetical protein